jgi:hypothetical protein
MQSRRPPHHAHHSRSLFQNRWTPAEATPSTSTTPTYWPAFSAGLNLSTISTFLTNPSISLVRVRSSEIHPHPPVKVVKPDWGHSNATGPSSEPPDLRATWLGHAVRRSRLGPIAAQPVVTHHFFFLPEFPRRVSAFWSRPR